MAPVLLPEATAIHAIPSCCDCFQAWRPYALWVPPDLEAPFHFPESCNPDSTRQLAMEQPAGRTTTGQLQPVLGSAAFQFCHISHSSFHSRCPLSSAGSWSGQQHSMPRLLPWFLLLPSFMPPSQLPSSLHFSSNQRAGSPVPPKPWYIGVAAPCGV